MLKSRIGKCKTALNCYGYGTRQPLTRLWTMRKRKWKQRETFRINTLHHWIWISCKIHVVYRSLYVSTQTLNYFIIFLTARYVQYMDWVTILLVCDDTIRSLKSGRWWRNILRQRIDIYGFLKWFYYITKKFYSIPFKVVHFNFLKNGSLHTKFTIQSVSIFIPSFLIYEKHFTIWFKTVFLSHFFFFLKFFYWIYFSII